MTPDTATIIVGVIYFAFLALVWGIIHGGKEL